MQWCNYECAFSLETLGENNCVLDCGCAPPRLCGGYGALLPIPSLVTKSGLHFQWRQKCFKARVLYVKEFQVVEISLAPEVHYGVSHNHVVGLGR